MVDATTIKLRIPDAGRWIRWCQKLSPEFHVDPIEGGEFCSPNLDYGRLKDAKFIEEYFGANQQGVFLFLFLYNQMGNDFLESLVAIMRKNDIPMHDFM